jgi:transcription antitermination factor NusG
MCADSREQPHWYAIQTWSRHEKMVRDQLAAKRITHLLPLWRKRSLRQDRVKYVEVPLFSGYLFGYFALLEKVAVLDTFGVARIVGMKGTAVPVPEEQIAAVRTMVEHRLLYDPHPYLVEGMRVRITRGVLMGAEGTLIEKRQRHRLVISVELIQQAVAVDVESADVEPLERRPRGISTPPAAPSARSSV